MSNEHPAANPHIGEKFLLLATIEGVYGDESMDISHRNATVVLDDGQRFATNLRNLLDPTVLAVTAQGQTAVDATGDTSLQDQLTQLATEHGRLLAERDELKAELEQARSSKATAPPAAEPTHERG